MGFFKRDLLLETRAVAPPEAVHYNFFTSDVIVVTKRLLEKLPPNQSKSVVGIAMIHWKAGYCYWDHLGHLVFLCGKLYICAVLQDVSRLKLIFFSWLARMQHDFKFMMYHVWLYIHLY